MRRMASRRVFRLFLHAIFYLFILLISNHTVFLVKFGIYLLFRVFQKGVIALARRRGSRIFSVLQNPPVQINSKLNSITTYT